MSEPLVPKEDVRATIEARRELGPSHEEELVDAFVARVERRLDERQPAKPVRTAPLSPAVAIVSVVMAIPLIAVAGEYGGGFGIVAVCVFLLIVNALYWDRASK